MDLEQIESALESFGPRRVGDHLVIDVGPDLGALPEAEDARYVKIGEDLMRDVQAALPHGAWAEHHDSGATILVYAEE